MTSVVEEWRKVDRGWLAHKPTVVLIPVFILLSCSEDANHLMQGTRDGSYLVRDSSDHKKLNYTLTVRLGMPQNYFTIC